MRKEMGLSLAISLGCLAAGCGGAESPTVWGSGLGTEGGPSAFEGYDLGCSNLGEIQGGDPLSLTVGYGLVGTLPTVAKHMESPGGTLQIDGPLSDFALTGVVLSLEQTDNEIMDGGEGDIVTRVPADLVLVAKPAGDGVSPESVSFEGVSLPTGGPACEGVQNECWREIHPTFVLCWDKASTGQRAYQILRPDLAVPSGQQAGSPPSSCGTLAGDAVPPSPGLEVVQGIGVYSPLLDEFAQSSEDPPTLQAWAARIDEALPRP